MTPHKRTKLLIDERVQGALVRRIIFYWLACVVTVEALYLAWCISTGPEQTDFWAYFTQQDWPAGAGRVGLCCFLLVPIMFDMLRLSHRFAGPVYRMRRVLRRVAEQGVVEKIELRDDDFWHEFADDLNAALARLSERHESLSAETESALGRQAVHAAD